MTEVSTRIYGFPRSGNHYLGALVARNFYNTDNYVPLMGGHGLPESVDPEIKYIYVFRNFDDVAKSVFSIRARFGMDEDNYGKFLKKKLRKMWSQNVVPNATWDTGSDAGNRMISDLGDSEERISGSFKNLDCTLEQYWQRHIEHWAGLSREHVNMHLVDYDRIKTEFYEIMPKIDTFLTGSVRDQYLNIEKKVGWRAK